MNEIATFKHPERETEPHSVEAEQQVLGAVLLGHSTDAVQAVGGADIFYDPVHADIYRVCRSLEMADKLVSPVTVKASISDELIERLQDLGGVGYIARMAGAAISPAFIADYASVMAEAKAKRVVLDVMRNAQGDIASGALSATDIAAKMESGLQALESPETRAKPVSMMRAVTEAVTEVFAAYEGEERNVVAPGLPALERYVPGFEPGEMWLIGGRPSMGKTGVALSIGLNAARAGHSVVIASLEMTPRAMALRALSEATARRKGITAYSSMRQGQFSEEQAGAIRNAAERVAELPIAFLPRDFQDTDLLQVGVKQALRYLPDDKTPLIIVDYAQLLRSKAKSRYEQITDVSLALKGIAMGLDVPVIALSQLNRSLESREDKRPMLSDLRESGQLEQDADGVIFCFRHEYYLERDEPDREEAEKYSAWMDAMAAQRNRLELIVAKQRQGAIGTAKMRFNPSCNLIWED